MRDLEPGGMNIKGYILDDLTEKAESCTPKEAAYILGISGKTIYRWIKVGEMEAVRIGRKLLQIPHKEVLRFKGEG